MTRVVETTGDTLLGVDIFRTLDGGARASIARHCHTFRYPPHHEVICNRDTSDDVYFVISGEVRATIFSRVGREVAFRDLPAGEMFGELSGIDSQPRCANVITQEESVVLKMSAAAFREVLAEHPEIALATLRRLTQLVRDLSDRVVEFSTLGVNNRIHAEILRIARQYPEEGGVVEITHPPTHSDIASRVSTRREAVTKELSRLTDMGLIERRGKSLLVRDVARLRHMIDDLKGASA